MAKCSKFCHSSTFFDAAPPGSNPAARVFRYPHSFFRTKKIYRKGEEREER
jgi:hypothetical protein